MKGHVPQEVILDIGATMFSKDFAIAVGIKVGDLARDLIFFFVGGAEEVSMCVSKEKVGFILARGTPPDHRVAVFVTMVDTTVQRVYCRHEGIV